MQLRWLHLSDLHAGQDTQSWLWPALQSHFFEDLDRLIPAMGGLDVVIFSGDLTQKGSRGDFDVLHKMLDKIWGKFAEHSCKPFLFMVPGNHDLIRPDESDPVTVAMRSWWERGNVKEAFWKSSDNAYRTFVDHAFSDYTKFKHDLLSSGFPVCTGTDGILPGDCSAVVERDGLKLGLVGLNSTYLQLSNLEKPSLDLDVRQLLAITDDDPDAWCRTNHINLLITHHPISWLAEPAVQHLNAEIYPPARFTAHLFGHMHTPEIDSLAQGGSIARTRIQAASLYGLRKYSNGQHDRIHGYSGARVEIGDDGGRILIWPRTGTTLTGGHRKFVPDNSFDLSEQNNFDIKLGRIPDLPAPSTLDVISPKASFGTAEREAALSATTRASGIPSQPLRSLPQHLNVRRLEQGKLKAAVETHRVAWISADWGYAADEFIGSVMSALSSPISDAYRVNLTDYRDRDSFLSRFATDIGCSFQEFCKSISGVERVLLILEDAPVSRPTLRESESWEDEVVSIVEAIREYCPNSLVILTSRQPPIRDLFPILQLKPLDEPDVKSYITHHSLGGAERANPSAIADVLRLTGGLPVEIDSILRELEFVSLSELIELRLTASRSESQIAPGFEGLMPVIEELKNSGSDTNSSRAFDLLVALSSVPYGETFSRIRRFNSQRAFYPSEAALLSDRGLIESELSTTALKVRSAIDAPSPKLIAKQIVRKAVEATLSPAELDRRDTCAATLYFGDKWMVGEPRSIRTADLAKALGGDGGLGNPHAVINSLLQRAVEVQDANRIRRAIQLARLFIASLGNGDNYRSSVTACQDFLRLIPIDDVYSDDINYFKWNLAHCYRMHGNVDHATEIFENLETSKFERRTRQRILIDWALAAQHSDPEKAKDLARQIVAMGKATLSGLQAQALLLELSPEIANRFDLLQALERRARSKKALGVANNIALFLANKGKGSSEDRRKRLRAVATSAKLNGDPYTAARGIVSLSLLGHQLSREEQSGLIEAYHYLYNERISNLFRRCHEGLWKHFVSNSDIENLLRLFRHSSFIWRIHGKESLEIPYIEQLSALISNQSDKGVHIDSAEGAYLLMRSEKAKLSPA
ncbi:metallophosphoesterase family protein [Paraburkholderia bannensis]|uniref:metallophosphoesterase family protein n=1 Tax=Paraburkholderia bannensis TaxID=765414 RepID=UPI002AAF8383|nr:metallophosphoesterase [Paraburkholderia bannensis]